MLTMRLDPMTAVFNSLICLPHRTVEALPLQHRKAHHVDRAAVRRIALMNIAARCKHTPVAPYFYHQQ
jgi:hypothetical protein